MADQPTDARFELDLLLTGTHPVTRGRAIDAYRDQVLTEAAELLRGAWTVAESALERDSLLGDDTALVGDVVKWAAGELLAARTVPAAPDNPPTA